jgi:AcrR family transcriptional regulator
LTTPVATDADADAPNQRSRILDAALALVSELGAAGTSMRRLAAACGLNVATIYHYFPSKADLLRAVIEERRYGERMAADAPPMEPALAPHRRLATLVAWVAERTLEEDTVLRLILGEGLRGDPTARQSATELVAALDGVAARWLAAGFPELAGTGASPEVVGRLVRGTLLAIVTEQLATGSTDIATHADDLAAVVFGGA